MQQYTEYTYYTYFTLCTLTSGMEAVEKAPSTPGPYRAWFSLPSLPTTARNKVCKPDSQACVFGNRIIFGSARTSFVLRNQLFSFFYSPSLGQIFFNSKYSLHFLSLFYFSLMDQICFVSKYFSPGNFYFSEKRQS